MFTRAIKTFMSNISPINVKDVSHREVKDDVQNFCSGVPGPAPVHVMRKNDVQKSSLTYQQHRRLCNSGHERMDI